jgi:hypothetical protein
MCLVDGVPTSKASTQPLSVADRIAGKQATAGFILVFTTEWPIVKTASISAVTFGMHRAFASVLNFLNFAKPLWLIFPPLRNYQRNVLGFLVKISGMSLAHG